MTGFMTMLAQAAASPEAGGANGTAGAALTAPAGNAVLAWFQAHLWQSILGGIALVVAVSLLVKHRAAIAKFNREVWTELGKCSWPWDPMQTGLRRYKELVDSTVVVIVSMLLLGGYTSLCDFILMKFTGAVMGVNL